MKFASYLGLLGLLTVVDAAPPAATRVPLGRTIDLNIGETVDLELADKSRAIVKVVDYTVTRDRLRDAVRGVDVQVLVNGLPVTLGCGNYHLPVSIGGVQIDCPMAKPISGNSGADTWGLQKDVRLRLWPIASPLVEPDTLSYPLRQKWFATATQMANEPTYVDGGEDPKRKKIYYHNDLDFGGCEGLTEVVASTDGILVSVANRILPGYEDTPAGARYDTAYILDDRGWYHRYLHLVAFEPGLEPGGRVKRGQKLGLLGKEGDSGGWSHLHYGIVSRQPSGRWGTEESYAYAWEAYRREYQPKLLAVARPHLFVTTGETFTLDATKSASADGTALRYEWTFYDGAKSDRPRVDRRYRQAGEYSEILKVTDARGNVAYDFAIILVVDPALSGHLPPAIHPTYWPTLGIKPGDPVTFKVRTFGTTHSEEVWNFGDGTPVTKTKSDGNVNEMAKDGYAVTTHRFEGAGTYIVTVEREDVSGHKAVGRLAVEVGVP
jgi:hypothetical protein